MCFVMEFLFTAKWLYLFFSEESYLYFDALTFQPFPITMEYEPAYAEGWQTPILAKKV